MRLISIVTMFFMLSFIFGAEAIQEEYKEVSFPALEMNMPMSLVKYTSDQCNVFGCYSSWELRL